MSSRDDPPPEQPAARSDSGRGVHDEHQDLGRSPSASTIPRMDRTGLGSDDSSILSLSPDLKGVEREGTSNDPELAGEATDRGRPYMEFMKAEMYFHENGKETSTDVTAMSAVASVTIVPLRRRFAGYEPSALMDAPVSGLTEGALPSILQEIPRLDATTMYQGVFGYLRKNLMEPVITGVGNNMSSSFVYADGCLKEGQVVRKSVLERMITRYNMDHGFLYKAFHAWAFACDAKKAFILECQTAASQARSIGELGDGNATGSAGGGAKGQSGQQNVTASKAASGPAPPAQSSALPTKPLQDSPMIKPADGEAVGAIRYPIHTPRKDGNVGTDSDATEQSLTVPSSQHATDKTWDAVSSVRSFISSATGWAAQRAGSVPARVPSEEQIQRDVAHVQRDLALREAYAGMLPLLGQENLNLL